MERKWCMNTETYTHTHIVIGTHTLFVWEIISKTHSSALILMSNMDLKRNTLTLKGTVASQMEKMK